MSNPDEQTVALVSAETVAARLSVTPTCVRKWANNRKIPGAYKLNGVWRFDMDKVSRWYRSQEREPKAWGSIGGGARGGFVSNGTIRKSDNRLEQLIGLKR